MKILSKLRKLLIFYRERILIYRIIKWIIYFFTSDLEINIFLKGLSYILKNPKINKKISQEENFKNFRGYNFKSLKEIKNLPILWNDIYGISIRLEYLMDKNLTNDKNYNNLLFNLIICYLEKRKEYTNNHLLNNYLILKRYSELSGKKFNFKSDHIKTAYNYVYSNNIFHERSSNYLFLISLRINKIKDLNFKNIFDEEIKYFSKILLKDFYRITWLGDITPDLIKIKNIKSEEKNLYYCNFGTFIFIKFKNQIIKISINNKIQKHGHDDFGSIIYLNNKLQIVDPGIDDLGNLKLKNKLSHANFQLGEFKNLEIKQDEILIFFEKCKIIINERGLNFYYLKYVNIYFFIEKLSNYKYEMIFNKINFIKGENIDIYKYRNKTIAAKISFDKIKQLKILND